ncbi:MAG: OmpA family protein [Myxococcales bacterium]|nr:OmpA family protein [Myxococcales bacterium]MCB9714414.1 OmpA family protein [Myxococcales bacterium]
MLHRSLPPLAALALAAALPAKATAAPVELVELGEDGEVAEEEAPDPALQRPWIRRYTPRRGMWETGFFGGVWLPSDVIELHDRNLPPIRYDLGAELGLRLGYYPLRHLGLEGELAMIPTRVETEQRAFVSTARAGAVVQLGLFRLVPFAVIGGGVIAVRSEPDAAGRNGDEMLYVGGGLKYFVNQHIVLRLEGRDMMSPKEGRTPAAPAHSGEVLLGFSLAFGPRGADEPPPPPDSDGDGFLDPDDACVDEAGIAPDGCPARDADGDGFLDAEDACADEAGTAPDGCPVPDSDGDGFLDPDDACIDEAGEEPDGCPIRDEDGDGLLAPQDQCPQEPETVNGFDDDDGCPDELPEEVKKYTGVIEGIFFDTGRSSIRDESFPTLDAAVKVLADYPSLRVEISGHTDDRGKRDKNLGLSQDRADAVKQYMVDKGIDAGRITTRGAGPDEPIGDNKTKAGRQQNRRIEFKLITEPAKATFVAPEPS